MHTCGLLDLRIPLVRADIKDIEVYYSGSEFGTRTPLRSRHQIEMEYLESIHVLNKDFKNKCLL